MSVLPWPADPLGERRYISDQRVALEPKTLQGSATRLLISDAAGVGNDHRNKPEVNGVSHSGLDADLESNATGSRVARREFTWAFEAPGPGSGRPRITTFSDT